MIEYWADKSKNELKGSRLPVLLPISSTEQHGNHLPVGTDHLLSKTIIEALVAKYGNQMDLRILPPLEYGKSTEHANYSGTLTLSAQTLLCVIRDITQSLKKQDIPSIVFVNTHGGNVGILDSILYDIRMEFSMEAYAIHIGKLFSHINPKYAFPTSMHAGYVETELMKSSYPIYKHLYEMTPNTITSTTGFRKLEKYLPLVSWGWATEDICQDGYMGDPSESTGERGKEILNATVDLLFDQLQLIFLKKDVEYD